MVYGVVRGLLIAVFATVRSSYNEVNLEGRKFNTSLLAATNQSERDVVRTTLP